MVLLSDPELRKFLRTSDENIVLVLCECFHNVIRGHVKVQINNLMQYENCSYSGLFFVKTLRLKRKKQYCSQKQVLIWFVSLFIFATSI